MAFPNWSACPSGNRRTLVSRLIGPIAAILLISAAIPIAKARALADAETPAPAPPAFDNFTFMGVAKNVTVGDIRYSYHRFGKTTGAQPALVMIQGLGGNQFGWPVPMLQKFAESREVIVFDNALAGLSVDTKAGQRPLNLTIPFMAKSTVDFIKKLQLEDDPDVLGLSMGGMVAQHIAINYGSAVRSVVVASSSYGKGAPEPAGGITNMVSYLGTPASAVNFFVLIPSDVTFANYTTDPSFLGLVHHLTSLQYAADSTFGLPGAGYGNTTIIPGGLAALYVSDATRAAQAAAILEYWTKSTLPGLAASKKRTLWIHGDKDAIFPVQTAQIAADTLRCADLEIMDAGHALFLAEPERFAKKVLKFLRSSSSAKGCGEREDKRRG